MAAALVAVRGGSADERASAFSEDGARDRVLFSGLYKQAAGSVFRFAWSLVHDESLAEDICAEVFLRAWRSRHGFRGDASPTAWLLSITRNCAMSELRRRRREEEAMQKRNSLADVNLDSRSEGISEHDLAVLQEALAELTEEQQQVIFLRFFEGLRHEEIGAILGRTSNAIRAAQFRALVRLRSILEEETS